MTGDLEKQNTIRTDPYVTYVLSGLPTSHIKIKFLVTEIILL